MTNQLVCTLKKAQKERYDKVCDRYNFIEEQDLRDLKLFQFHDAMIQLLVSLGLNLDMKCISFLPQYVKYTLTPNTSPYTIDEHNDSSVATIILYLTKDSKIYDEFWVEKNKVNENVWEANKGLVMFKKGRNGSYNVSGPEHRGVVRGIGEREILCFFISCK